MRAWRLLISAMVFPMVFTTSPVVFAQWPARGERVTVTRSNGFAYEGRVTSMNEREIKFQTSRGREISYRGADLQSVRTQTDTFTWDAKQNRFVSAKAAEAKAAPEKLKGIWCGLLRHIPAQVASDSEKQVGVHHALCLLYLDKVNATGATGVLQIPDRNFKTNASFVCKPLSDNQHEKSIQKFFDVECSLDTDVPLPSGATALKRFPTGVALTTFDGLLPKGLSLLVKSVRPDEVQAKDSAYTELLLTRQEDIQASMSATVHPLKLVDADLKFQQGTYRRKTKQLYETDKVKEYVPNLLGPGFHPVYKTDWKAVTNDQYVPHVRVAGTIKNPSSQAYDVKLVCMFHVDNETMMTRNMPHRAVFNVRVPANKSSVFGDGHTLRNTEELFWKGAGLLGTLMLGGQAISSEGDNNWHVAHVTKVTAAIISATPVSDKKTK